MIQNKRTVAYGLLALLAVAAVLLTVDLSPRVEYTPEPEVVEVVDTVPAVPTAYGIPLPGFVVEQEQVGRGATFGDLLTARGVPYPVIDSLVRLGEGKFVGVHEGARATPSPSCTPTTTSANRATSYTRWTPWSTWCSR